MAGTLSLSNSVDFGLVSQPVRCQHSRRVDARSTRRAIVAQLTPQLDKAPKLSKLPKRL